MGYRRLPTTDKARYLALERMSNIIGSDDLGVLLNKEKELMILLDEFGNLLEKRERLAEQKKHTNRIKSILTTKLRLYVSHYLQVLNFSIDRGEMDKMVRKLYGLQVNMGNIPELSNIEHLMTWVEKIINGEEKRVLTDKMPISHPNVKKIEGQKEQLIVQQQELLTIENEIKINKQKIVDTRFLVDQFIKQAWNDIEAKFSNETNAVKQQKAARYGVVYVN
ncbi:MAG: hypothetical protein KF732_00030 [Flavobacteriales bacterium]|nr:hypothetical protein [Flavobacteriales bacterium]